jgi:hypothetical protein
MSQLTRREIALISLIVLSLGMWWIDRTRISRKLPLINYYISTLETMRDSHGNLILGKDAGNFQR